MYVIVTTYSYDTDITVAGAKTFDEAQKKMQKAFEEEKRVDTEENGYEIKSEHIEEGFAQLVTIYPTLGEGTTTWNIKAVV